MSKLQEIDFSKEWIFKTSRSSGKGGQHVNKVETRVELRFDINNSELLSEDEKLILTENLQSKTTKDDILIIVASSERSQLANKKITIKKFYDLIEEGLKTAKERIPTEPSEKSKLKRLKDKKIQSKKKRSRTIDPTKDIS